MIKKETHSVQIVYTDCQYEILVVVWLWFEHMNQKVMGLVAS